MPKMRPRMTSEERMNAEAEMNERLQNNSVTIGQAVREIRQRWLGIHQAKYAKMVGISKTTLGSVERDEGSATMETLEKVLRPLGYRLTITPARKNTKPRQAADPKSQNWSTDTL